MTNSQAAAPSAAGSSHDVRMAIRARAHPSRPSHGATAPPMSLRQDAEFFVLHHHVMVLVRQLHGEKIRFTWAHGAFQRPTILAGPRSLRLLILPTDPLRWDGKLNVHVRSHIVTRKGSVSA